MNRLFFSLALIISLAGCAANHASTTDGPHAECLVCKYNADLACIDVKVDDRTPRYSYAGKTYYFCSDDCRDKFEKNPDKYIQAKR